MINTQLWEMAKKRQGEVNQSDLVHTLVIERTRLKLFETRINSQTEVLISPLATYEWTSKTLVDVCSQIAQTFQIRQLEVVVADDLGITGSVVVSNKKQAIEEAEQQLKQKWQQYYPQLQIDFHILELEGLPTLVQFFAIKKNLLETLATAFQSEKIKVSYIESLAQAVARISPDPQLHLLIWDEAEYVTSAVVFDGEVLEAQVGIGSEVYKQISSLLSWTETKLGLSIKEVYMATKKTKKTKVKKTTGKTPKDTSLDPVAGSLQANHEFAIDSIYTEIETEDEADQTEPKNKSSSAKKSSSKSEPETEKTDSENLTDSAIIQPRSAAPKPPISVQGNNKEMESVAKSGSRTNTKLITLIVMIIVILLGLVVGGWFVYSNALSTANQPPEIVENATPFPEFDVVDEQSEEATETAEPVVIEREEVSVSVLNGSGAPGAAGDLAAVLEAAGYGEIDTGNADNYDYETTEVQVKVDNQELFDLISQDLSDDYTVTQGDDLDEDSQFDAVVIVGAE